MIPCSICRQLFTEDSYSKKQIKNLNRDKLYKIKCATCIKSLESTEIKNEEIIDKDAQVTSPGDPSMIHFKNPVKAPIVNTFTQYFEAFNVNAKVNLGKKTQWRTVVKLAVRSEIKDDGQISTSIGLFEPGTHKVVNCHSSLAHRSRINKAAELIKACVDELAIGGYVEGSGADEHYCRKYKAYIKYLLLSLERNSGLVQLTFVWNSLKDNNEARKHLIKLKDKLIEKTKLDDNSLKPFSSLFHSIWVNFHSASQHCNTITSWDSQNWELLFGKESMQEKISTDMVKPPVLFFPPFVFRQANIDAFTLIIQEIRNQIKTFAQTIKSDNQNSLLKCMELYGGVGTIGLNCLDLINNLHCSDENPNNLICFNKSLEKMSIELKNKAKYTIQSGSSQTALNNAFSKFNLFIVDPPRKGMDEETLKALVSLHITENMKSQTVSNDLNPIKKQKKLYFDDSVDPLENDSSVIVLDKPKNEISKHRRLVYVSCGFEAFQRDCQYLMGSNYTKDIETNLPFSSRKRKESEMILNPESRISWKLSFAEGYILFPGSNHIETLAIFDAEIP